MLKINLSKQFKFINIFIKNNQENIYLTLAEFVVLFMRFGVPVILYSYVFRLNGGSVNGLTLQAAVWSMFFYFPLLALRLREIPRNIERDIRTGNMEMFINKPINYIFYKILEQVGTGFTAFLGTIILGSFCLYLFVGLADSMKNELFVVSIIITTITAIVLNALVYSILGILAFYMEDISSVYRIIDKINMVLGGAYLPVYLFPQIIRNLAIYSPFGAMFFVSHTVYDYWKTDYIKLLSIQVFYIFLLSIVLTTMYRLSLRKLSVNGG